MLKVRYLTSWARSFAIGFRFLGPVIFLVNYVYGFRNIYPESIPLFVIIIGIIPLGLAIVARSYGISVTQERIVFGFARYEDYEYNSVYSLIGARLVVKPVDMLINILLGATVTISIYLPNGGPVHSHNIAISDKDLAELRLFLQGNIK